MVDEMKRQAFAGDYRALKDQMMSHLPEAGVRGPVGPTGATGHPGVGASAPWVFHGARELFSRRDPGATTYRTPR